MKKVIIVDYGLGNLGSIANMIRKCGWSSEISANHTVINKANCIILPGVGAFDRGMDNIEQLGLLDILKRKANEDLVPFLGICLGMQLMTKRSQEGNMNGLGFIDAYCKRFESVQNLRIPHMGWNSVKQLKKSRFVNNVDSETRYYFVHSYHVVCNNPDVPLFDCDYGGNFTAAFEHRNLLGVQFHPEKSHNFGKELISGFLNNA
jgi:glutamine amidotransferase